MSRNLVAILRGVRPEEAVDVAQVIVDAGISIVEVPLNSPSALSSIESLAQSLGDRALIGAGTVTTTEQVDGVAAAGGRIVVSPNCDHEVIERSIQHGMTPMPGVFTPSECFSAIKAGARRLKLFPAQIIGPSGVKALKAVLPAELELYAVGGVSLRNFDQWLEAGVSGFGIGTSLYQPGDDTATVASRARALVEAYDAACAKAAT